MSWRMYNFCFCTTSVLTFIEVFLYIYNILFYIFEVFVALSALGRLPTLPNLKADLLMVDNYTNNAIVD